MTTQGVFCEIPGITPTRRVRIEMLIARGLDAADIAARLGCALEDVAAVWQRMEAFAREVPLERPWRRKAAS